MHERSGLDSRDANLDWIGLHLRIMTGLGRSLPSAWVGRPAAVRPGVGPLPVQQLRQLVARARGWAPEAVYRGRLITRQLMTEVAADYPFPDQVQVIRLSESTCLVTTESMVWQHGDHVRQELMDGTLVLVQNDRTRWKVYYWPTDTFYQADDPGVAVREDDPQFFDTRRRLPPLPAGDARLLAEVDPIGDVTAVLYRDVAAWQFTMPIDTDPRDPRRGDPGYSSIIAAHTGYLMREWSDTLPPSDWFDITSDVTVPPDHFTWTARERSVQSLLDDRR